MDEVIRLINTAIGMTILRGDNELRDILIRAGDKLSDIINE